MFLIFKDMSLELIHFKFSSILVVNKYKIMHFHGYEH